VINLTELETIICYTFDIFAKLSIGAILIAIMTMHEQRISMLMDLCWTGS